MENNNRFATPEITEVITVDKLLHVRLFSKSSSIPLPECFRKGSDCQLRRKSKLEHFPPHIKYYLDAKNIPSDILTELQEIRF